MSRRTLKTVSLLMLALILVSIVSATAASNTVPPTNADEQLRAITANDLKPAECAALNLTAKLGGSGTINGTAASELIVGGSGADRIDGLGGDDCIVTGAGGDTLIGGVGMDFCLGGTGADTYDPSCENRSDPDPTPACATPGSQTVVANRDSFIQQKSPTQNSGTATNLLVTSDTGNRNARALVGFALPSVPSGCSVTSATLRLYDNAPAAGRTIQAYQITATWTETGVTWNNQPTIAATAATSTSPSAASYQSWTVTDQVRQMYAGANHGFLLRDQVENASNAVTQTYLSRENASTNRPQLVVNWG